jgi:hypothetical protein
MEIYMKGNTILKTGLACLAAMLPVFLFSACPMDTPENSPSPSYTISYSPGEGSGSIASVIKKEGETIRLSDGTGFTAPEGKSFENWKDGAGNAYAAGSSYSKDEDLSLTAQWKAPEPEIKKTITITNLPGTYSSLAVYLSAVQDLSGSSDIAAAGGLPSGGSISGGQVSYLLYRYSEGGGSSPLWTDGGSYYVYLCWNGSTIATEVSTAKISFDEETTTISYTGKFQAFTQKKVEVLNQSGSITEGTGGTATYQINRYNITSDTVTIKWYSDSAGTAEISTPAGISDNTGSLAFTSEGDHEKSTITITVSAAVSAGTYYFRAFMEGQSYYSAVKSLSVGGIFNALELNGWNVMVDSADAVDAARVSSAHIYDGDSGKIYYDGGARVLTYWYNSAKHTAILASPADDVFHLLFSNIGTGNDIKIGSGKVERLLKMEAAEWNINFDSIQSILSGYVILGNWATSSNEPVKISGTFPGTTLSLVGDHTDDAFAVPDGSSLIMWNDTKLSFNSNSHLVLGTNSSLVLAKGAGMAGYGTLVAGQTEFSFGDSENSGWGVFATDTNENVTITRTGAYTSSITGYGPAASLVCIHPDTQVPVITQKGGSGNSLTIGCPVYLGRMTGAEGLQKAGSLVLEGGNIDGCVTLSGNSIISTQNYSDDSTGDPGTGITGLYIDGNYVLRKENNKFLFIKPNSGTIDILAVSSDFELSAETVVN